MDPGFLAITALALGFVGWYGIGTVYNRHKSNTLLKKAWDMLRKYKVPGDLTSLGSSGFIIKLKKGTKHFKALIISVILEKRELPINWVIDLLRGKRDTLTVQIVIKNQLPINAEAYRLKSYFGEIARKLAEREGFTIERRGQVEIAYSLKHPILNQVARFLGKNSKVWWISLRKDKNTIVVNAHVDIVDRLEQLLKFVENINVMLKVQQ